MVSIQKELVDAVTKEDMLRIRDAIAARASVNARSFSEYDDLDSGASVLFNACLEGNLAIIKLLVDAGADVNLIAEEPAASVLAPKVLDLALQCKFLMDWVRLTPIVELLAGR